MVIMWFGMKKVGGEAEGRKTPPYGLLPFMNMVAKGVVGRGLAGASHTCVPIGAC